MEIGRISADWVIEHASLIKVEEERKCLECHVEWIHGVLSPVMRKVVKNSKLNDLNFYDYINNVLTRLMRGETDYKSLIPCNYKPLPSAEEQKEVA